MIDSIVMSWDQIKKHYTITVLTTKSGLIVEHADDMQEAISIINVLEEEHA